MSLKFDDGSVSFSCTDMKRLKKANSGAIGSRSWTESRYIQSSEHNNNTIQKVNLEESAHFVVKS